MAAMDDAAPRTDEISLRDLYLVLRRRAPWIAAVALLAGVVAFLVLSARPSVFVAEATAVVARAPVEVSLATGLRFRPEVDLTFETYQTLAYSRGVLEAVLPSHEAGNLASLRASLSLERVAGSANQPSSLLAVVHRVRAGGPAQAAAAATAWAAATVAAARRLLLENLDAVETITNEDLGEARARLDEIQVELESFRAVSAVESLRVRVGFTRAAADGGSVTVAGTLDLAIADVEAQLRRQRVAAGQVAAELAALRQRAAIEGPDVDVVLFSAPGVVLPLAGALASVEVQAAALAAEQEALTAELAALWSEREAAAAALAEASATLSRLERDARGPAQVVDSLAAIEPAVAYVARVAPSGARVLSEAVVPTAPEPSRRTLVALLAVVVVAFVGVVVALLAEAVRDPGSGRPAAGATAAGAARARAAAVSPERPTPRG